MSCDCFVFAEERDEFRMWQGLVGPYYTPAVDSLGNLSWTNNGNLVNPPTVNVSGRGLTITGIVDITGDLPASAPQYTCYLVGTTSPYHAYIWDGTTWADLGIVGKGDKGDPGDDGFSPTVTVSAITGGHQVAITDATGTDTFNVMDGVDGAPGQGVPVGGTAGQVLKKKSATDYDTEWANAGTADALPLAGGTMSGSINMDGNRVQNLPTPSANGDAVTKSYADGLLTGYRTASAQDVIDTEQDADIASRAKTDEIGIVINGNSTPVGASAGQYVIVKDSTISGVADGLYTAAQAIPANTAIDATYLSEPISGGGLNSLIQIDDIAVSGSNNSTISGNYSFSIGPLIFVSFYVTIPAASNDWHTIAHLSVRPQKDYFCRLPLRLGDSPYIVDFSFNTSGEVRCYYGSQTAISGIIVTAVLVK